MVLPKRAAGSEGRALAHLWDETYRRGVMQCDKAENVAGEDSRVLWVGIRIFKPFLGFLLCGMCPLI